MLRLASFLLLLVTALSSAGECDALIRGLGAERFDEREHAERGLMSRGRTALPALKAALQNEDPEIGLRARRVITAMFDAEIVAGVRALSAQEDSEMDIEQGMWLMARLVEPDLKKAPIDKSLDKLAEQLRAELGPTPKTLPAPEIVAGIQKVLFAEDGFSGDEENYDHPDNSAIHRVLAEKHGLPILLSHVVVAVTDRLELPVHGIQVPGRYMIKVVGAKEEIILNPFEGGKIETPLELRRTRFAHPDRHLVPSPKRDTLSRMMRNIVSDFLEVGEGAKAMKAQELLLLIELGP